MIMLVIFKLHGFLTPDLDSLFSQLNFRLDSF